MRDTFIQARLDGITPPDGAAMEAARRHWDAIAKPLHGLGRLEDMVVRIAGAVETPEVRLDRKGSRAYHRRVQIIFQNPEASLDPSMRIRDSLLEAMAIHRLGESREERMEKIRAALGQVGLF